MKKETLKGDTKFSISFRNLLLLSRESEAFRSLSFVRTFRLRAARLLFIAPHIKINFPTKIVFVDLWTIQFNSLYIVQREPRLANLLQLNSIIQILSRSLHVSLHSNSFCRALDFPSSVHVSRYVLCKLANLSAMIYHTEHVMIGEVILRCTIRFTFSRRPTNKPARHTFFHTNRWRALFGCDVVQR